MRRLFKTDINTPLKDEENRKTLPNRYSSQEAIVPFYSPPRERDSTESVATVDFYTAQTRGFALSTPKKPRLNDRRDVVVQHFGVNDRYSRPEISVYRDKNSSAPNTSRGGLQLARVHNKRITCSVDFIPIWKIWRMGKNSSDWMDGSTYNNRLYDSSNQVQAFAPDVEVEKTVKREKRKRGITDVEPYLLEDLMARRKIVKMDSEHKYQDQFHSRGYNTYNVFRQDRITNASTDNINSNQTEKDPDIPKTIFHVRSPSQALNNHQKPHPLAQTSKLPQDFLWQIPLKFDRDTLIYTSRTSFQPNRSPGHHKKSSRHPNQNSKKSSHSPPSQPQNAKRSGSKPQSPARQHNPFCMISTTKPSYVRVNDTSKPAASGPESSCKPAATSPKSRSKLAATCNENRSKPATIGAKITFDNTVKSSKHPSRHAGKRKEKKRKTHCKCRTENCNCTLMVCDMRDKSRKQELCPEIVPVHKPSVKVEKAVISHDYSELSSAPPKSSSCHTHTSSTRDTASVHRQQSPKSSSHRHTSSTRATASVHRQQSPKSSSHSHKSSTRSTASIHRQQSPKSSSHSHESSTTATASAHRTQSPVKATLCCPCPHEPPIQVIQAPPRYQTSCNPPLTQPSPTPPINLTYSEPLPSMPLTKLTCPFALQPTPPREEPNRYPSILKHQSSLDFTPIWYQQRGSTSSDWLDGGTYYDKKLNPTNQPGAFAPKVSVEKMVKLEKLKRNIKDVAPYSDETIMKKPSNKGSSHPGSKKNTRNEYSTHLLQTTWPVTWNRNVKPVSSNRLATVVSTFDTNQSVRSPFAYSKERPYYPYLPVLGSPSSTNHLSSESWGPAYDSLAFNSALDYNRACNCVIDKCGCRYNPCSFRNRAVDDCNQACNCVIDKCGCQSNPCSSRNRTVSELTTRDKCITPSMMSACSLEKTESRTRISRNESCHCKTEDCYCIYEPCASRERAKRRVKLKERAKHDVPFKPRKVRRPTLDDDKCILCRVDAVERPFSWWMRTCCITWVWSDKEFKRHCGKELGPLPEYKEKPPSLGNSFMQRWWSKRYVLSDEEIV